ncbi:MAG: hypothetical protein HY243_17025 [Proteobacteria bacterium]|nr:hypothetical protein [Pseudomonadota bacterium]
MSDLEALLREPPSDMPDDGFTAKVVSRIAEARIRRARNEALVMGAGVAAALALLPFTDFGKMLQQQVLSLDTSLPVALTLAALVFSAAALQALRD